MKIFQFLFFYIFDIYASVNAQSLLQFDTKNCKSFSFGLSKVTVIDQRIDSGIVVGFVKDGKFNSKQQLLAQPSLSILLENYYTQLSDLATEKSKNELVILVHKFSAREDNTGISEETARFIFQADYFISDDKGLSYQLLGLVNEVVFVNSLDVTQLFLKTIDRSLCSFYEDLYRKKMGDSLVKFTYSEVLNFKEIQKKYFRAYVNDTFKNAYYTNWEEFLILRSKSYEELVKRGKRIKLATTYLDGSVSYSKVPYETKIIAFGNKLFIRYDGRNYLLSKKKNDFYFVGYTPSAYTGHNGFIQKNARNHESFINSTRIKVEGDLPKNFYGYYEFKIDPRTGNLLPIKK